MWWKWKDKEAKLDGRWQRVREWDDWALGMRTNGENKDDYFEAGISENIQISAPSHLIMLATIYSLLSFAF